MAVPAKGLEAAAIAANRFGLGARPGELKTIAGDPRGWLAAQMTPEPALPAPLAALPPTGEAATAFARWIASIGIGPQALAADSKAAAGAKLPQGMTIEQSFVQAMGPGHAAAVAARFQTATQTDRPFFERWVRFWSNHFTLSVTKPQVIALPQAFERDVIRPNAMGSFAAMLTASTRHPGMLVYLDNIVSIGPNSFLAKRPQFLPDYARERMKGLNENLAREILELHTLGVRSGYTQDDVVALAKIITGWSARQGFNGEAPADPFNFIRAAHEPGPQTLLGKVYTEGGLEQGERALADLAAHPATARHCATKIARHFVADEPPPAVVDRLAAAFQRSNGDLKAVAVALVDSPEAWSPTPAKIKPPDDYLVSAVRATGGPPLKGAQLTALLTRMGQRPWAPPGPDGWPDIQGAWIGADAVWKRIEWASAAAQALGSAGLDPAAVADDALGPQLSEATLRAVRGAESPAQGLALFLVSPEFQRR